MSDYLEEIAARIERTMEGNNNFLIVSPSLRNTIPANDKYEGTDAITDTCDLPCPSSSYDAASSNCNGVVALMNEEDDDSAIELMDLRSFDLQTCDE